MTKFEIELVALLKKHNITSLDKLCYNNPEKVAEYKQAKEDYQEAYDKYLEENGDCPPRVYKWSDGTYSTSYEYGYGYENTKDRYRGNSTEKAYDTYTSWIYNCPQEPDRYDYNIVNEYDDDDYIKSGLWYSSKC